MKVEAGEYRDYLEKAYMDADLRWPRNFGFEKSLPPDDIKRLLAEHAPVHDVTLRTLVCSPRTRHEAGSSYGCEDLQAPTTSSFWLQQHRI